MADEGLIPEVDSTSARQFLVGDHTPRYETSRNRDAEKACAKESGLKEIRRIKIGRDRSIRLLVKHCERGYRRVEQHQPPLPHQSRTGKRDEQQYAHAASCTATEIHEQGQRQDIHQHMRAQLQIETAAIDADSGKRNQRRHEIQPGDRQMIRPALRSNQ